MNEGKFSLNLANHNWRTSGRNQIFWFKFKEYIKWKKTCRCSIY